MTVQVIDSDRRCPRDGKLMMVQVGADENESGWVRMVHECWHCDYREIDENWKRPKIRTHTGPTMAERLLARRLGETPAVSVWEYVYPGEVPQ